MHRFSLAGWLLVAILISLIIISHETIAYLRPYYTASQPWATRFWQEHLTVWEYRLVAGSVVFVLCLYTLLRGRYVSHR